MESRNTLLCDLRLKGKYHNVTFLTGGVFFALFLLTILIAAH